MALREQESLLWMLNLAASLQCFLFFGHAGGSEQRLYHVAVVKVVLDGKAGPHKPHSRNFQPLFPPLQQAQRFFHGTMLQHVVLDAVAMVLDAEAQNFDDQAERCRVWPLPWL